jgi:hypothetical protein
VVLATAHLDHDPTNNHPHNLRALGQRCHMIHDRDEHLRRRAMTFRARCALGDLFTGPYRSSEVVSLTSSTAGDSPAINRCSWLCNIT